ncbi:hypothetical protein JCM8097_001590 [Rhodosporidiobolus ruineniae]
MPKSEESFDPARPFSCPECGSRYTRQEHLDRHVTAKHRVAKDFVCPICHKGFARKDILKRHQAGHEKQQQAAAEAALRGDLVDDDDRRSVGSASKPKKKRPVVASTSDIAVEDAGGPVKIARVGRACCRCSKSKLRCDGQNPCERCRKAGIECSFDRPAKGPPSRQGSVSMMPMDDYQHSPTLESDSSTTSPENAFSLPALPTPPPGDGWGRQLGNAAAQASMSLYNMPLRGSPHHQQSLPPNSFQHGGPPPPVNYYSGRPPESFHYRNPSPYHAPPNFASLSLPYHQPSPLNPYAQSSSSLSLGSLPAAAAASSSAQWDTSANGRQIGGADESNSLDFLGLVTGGGADDGGIDWSILSSGFSREHDPILNNVQGSLRTGFTPRDGMSPAPGASGNVDLSLLTSALTAPAQPVSDLRNGNERASSFPLGSTHEDESAIDDEEEEDLPENPPIPVRTNSIVESDRAAVSLLQLASHTPRVSPEPQAPGSSTGANGPSSSATKPSFPRGHFSLLNPATEEALRTSHPTHSPSASSSDPWPLSYRPTDPTEEILPASARGTGYFSRATSPPPHAAHLSLNHVPSVTEATRLRILYKVRELSDPGLSERFVPRLELLELFVQLYFEKYHALFPLVHKPTWDPNTAPSFLVLAVASVGARYAHERVVGANMHAHALLEAARRMAQLMGDLDNTLLRTVAWQQTLLIVLQSGIFSGNKRDLERTQAFASMPITFARRQGWFKDPRVDEAAEELLPLDDRWKRWRNREEIRRLGFGAVVFDCAATALWNLESLSLYLDAANTALPCHDALWDAPTSTAWAALFRHTVLPSPSPTLSQAIHLICTSSSASSSSSSSSELSPILRDTFALSTILSVLNALGWARGHARSVERTFLEQVGVKKEAAGQGGEEKRDEVDATQAALEAGLEFYQDRILLPPDMLARLDDQGPTGGTMALFVHLTVLQMHLPLRVLQPFARTTLAPLPAATTSALRAWSTASHGAVARTTAYHAGQLLALCRPSSSSSSLSVGTPGSSYGGGAATSSAGSSEGPLEPFAIFYAALALVAFIRESAAASSSAPSATATATKDGDSQPQKEDQPRPLELDQLKDRSDGELQQWIHSGPLDLPPLSAAEGGFSPTVRVLSAALGAESTAPPSATATEPIKLLQHPRAAELVLVSAARRLASLKVWKVGENLAGVLDALAKVERGKQDERDAKAGLRGFAAGGGGSGSSASGGSVSGRMEVEGLVAAALKMEAE